MMCHPKTGDLLLSRADRILSGIRFRSRMCAGGDVLHLYGRLQGCRAGCGSADSTRSLSAGPIAVAIAQQGVTRRKLHPVQQHQLSIGVDLKKPSITVPAGTVFGMESVMAEPSLLPAATEARPHVSRAPEAPCAPMSSRRELCSADADPALPLPQVSETDAAAESALCSGSMFSTKIRRVSRKIAGGEQIPTGTNCTKTQEGGPKVSVIVLVTSSGNVTVRAN
jgi:hypothetical protein